MRFFLILFATLLTNNALPCQNCLGIISPKEMSLIKKDAYILPLKHIQQKPYLCVPASASMILEYYGHKADQSKLKSLISKVNPDTKKNHWTKFSELINALDTKGISWREISYNKKCDCCFEKGYNLIISEIKSNRPVICNSIILNGHAFVIHGYTENYSFIISDSAVETQYRILNKQEFKEIWGEYNDCFRSIVLTSKKI